MDKGSDIRHIKPGDPEFQELFKGVFLPWDRPLWIMGVVPTGFRTAILNSRKSRKVNPGESWLIETQKAVRNIAAEGKTIITSMGMLHYDFVLHCAMKEEAGIIVVLDTRLPPMMTESMRKSQAVYEDFFLSGITTWVSFTGEEKQACGRAERRKMRDRLVVSLSHELAPVRIRKQGNMWNLMKEFAENGGKIRTVAGDHFLESPSERRGKKNDPGKRGNVENAGEKLRYAGNIGEDFLFHYTRSHPGPWPGQSITEYFNSLIERKSESAHSGYHTLCRILRQRSINAGARLIRGRHPVVCFTELGPECIHKIRQWQSHLIRWNFEPYAIAFRRSYAERKRVLPVLYRHSSEYPDIEPSSKYLFQKHEPPDTDWSQEREHRKSGDFNFDDCREEDFFVIVPDVKEAESIVRKFDVRAYVFCWD